MNKENIENVFVVHETIGCLIDALSLPEDVKKSLFDVALVCEPYIKNGFSYTFPVCD